MSGQVLNGEALRFVCNESGQAAVWADGSRATEFSLACDSAGEFVETWPETCEAYEGCVAR